MQAQCPECTTRFQLDDSKVPDHAFKVRCPRCQHVVVLPGRQDAARPAPAEAAPPAARRAGPATPPPPPPPPKPLARPSRLKREHTGTDEADDALVAIPDADLAKAFTETLARLDYNVDVAEDVEEGARLLEQGAYAIAVTAKTADRSRARTASPGASCGCTPDMRRRVFVILAGDQFQTADGTQAWGGHGGPGGPHRRRPTCDGFIRSTMAESKRLYQPTSTPAAGSKRTSEVSGPGLPLPLRGEPCCRSDGGSGGAGWRRPYRSRVSATGR